MKGGWDAKNESFVRIGESHTSEMKIKESWLTRSSFSRSIRLEKKEKGLESQRPVRE